MKSKEILFRLLYYALLDVRYDAHESKNSKIFAISNAMHNLPLKLLNANDEADFQSILADYELSIHDNKGLSNMLKQVKEKVDGNYYEGLAS